MLIKDARESGELSQRQWTGMEDDLAKHAPTSRMLIPELNLFVVRSKAD